MLNFSKNQGTEEEQLELNLTSLIDVVFLLLIFFMVSTSFVSNNSINVELPTASAKKSEPLTKSREIRLSKNGIIQLDGNTITIESLKSELNSSSNAQTNTTLVVRADKDAAHGQVVTIMDLAQQAGITSIAVAVQSNTE